MNNTIGLYIHIPFCKNKCPYCDFYSIYSEKSRQEDYVSALLDKISFWASQTGKKAETVYFGGGTPSILGSSALCRILKRIYQDFSVSSNAEITVEINPESGKKLNFEKLYSAGFNRLSIGLQSANKKELELLGRIHSLADVKETLSHAKQAGFENCSLDLMLGIPAQTKESLKQSIEFCTACGVKHVSAYILKIEKGTDFYKNARFMKIPDEDTQADLYLFACEQLEKNGFQQYEISNFAQKGFAGRHNLKYWMDEEYIGIGASAHSFFNGKRFHYSRSIPDFKDNQYIYDGTGGDENEFIMLNLRLIRGLRYAEYQERFGKKLPSSLLCKAKKFEKLGLLNINEQGIQLTRNGFLLSNTILSEFI